MVGSHVRGICQRCGFEYPRNKLKREWTGLLVCPEDFDPRHPQDRVRARPDRQAVRNPAPEPDPIYLPTLEWSDDLGGWARYSANVGAGTYSAYGSATTLAASLTTARTSTRTFFDETEGEFVTFAANTLAAVNGAIQHPVATFQRLSAYPTSGDTGGTDVGASSSAISSTTRLGILSDGALVASDGETWHRRNYAAGTLTAAQTYAFGALYRAPDSDASGRARVILNGPNFASEIAGAIGSLAVASEFGGAITGLTETLLAEGVYLLTGLFVPDDTGSHTIGIGPDAASGSVEAWGRWVNSGSNAELFVDTLDSAATTGAETWTFEAVNGDAEANTWRIETEAGAVTFANEAGDLSITAGDVSAPMTGWSAKAA